MRLYCRWWRGFWSAAMVLAVAVAVLEWSLVRVLLFLGLLVAVCWLVTYLLPARIIAGLGSPPGPRSLPLASTVALTILMVLSFSTISPALALLVMLTAVVTSPAVVRRAIGSMRRTRPPGVAAAKDGIEWGEGDRSVRLAPAVGAAHGDHADDEEDGLTTAEVLGPLSGLDDRQLCRVWRESFWALRTAAPPGTLLCLVALREACLDELERRHAAGVHAWLDSGARASSGPEKYLEDS